MTDTNRNGIGTLHHHPDALANLDSNSGSQDPPRNELAVQKRTRSQHDVSDLILRLPLSRSPLKDARKAHVKARSTSTSAQVGSRLSEMAHGAMVNGAEGAGAMKVMHKAEGGMEMDDCAGERVQRYWEEEGSQDSLSSLPSADGGACDKDSTMWPTTSGKRTSPDTDAMRVLSSQGGERRPKRAKVERLEGFRFPGYRQDHMEYREPLHDSSQRTPKAHKRASSTKQTPSSSKVASSILFRAQSVPLGGENEVRAIDFTVIPPSPQRSPSKGAVEIRRALSVPPPDDEKMDIDAVDNSALLHITVNFATPRRLVTPRPSSRSTTPLSPLTPVPSPLSEHLPMQHFSAKANVKSPALRGRTPSNSPTSDAPMADTTILMDASQSIARIPSRSSSATSVSRPGSADTSRSPLIRPTLTSSKLTELVPPLAVAEESSLARALTVPEDFSQAKNVSSNNTGGAGELFTDESELSSPPSSPPGSIALSVPLPPIIDALPRKRGPFIPQGPRRVTRSASMKVERVKGETPEVKDPLATCDTTQASAMSGLSPRAAEITPKPRSPRSTSAMVSKPKPPPPVRRSISASKPPLETIKLKQASLNLFMKARPPTGAGSSAVRASTSSGSSSRLVPSSSPSKIPLPASCPSTTQLGSTKPLLFSPGSTSSGAETGTARATSGRSLTTLSHALDKLVVPPPGRPNTSMGLVREDGQSDKEEVVEDSKGKRKAKDDASVPVASTARGLATTFARPTASSLNRAATVMGIRSTTTLKTRGGAASRERGKTGIFGRVGDRASKKTSLPVVAGSPVKGSGGIDDLDEVALGAGKHKLAPIFGSAKDSGGAAGTDNVFMSPSVMVSNNPEDNTIMRVAAAEASMSREESTGTQKSSLAVASPGDVVDIDLTTPISVDKERQRVLIPSKLNPASSALHALSESLSSLPQTPTPPKPRAMGTRTGLRSSTAGAGKESPVFNGSSSVDSGGNSEVHGTGPSNGTVNNSDGVKKSSLKILTRCVIFVDVRTEQGDDAGSLFVDMLKGLGAKIMSRLGRKCTHIVYKNGLPSTLARYRLLDDPKPIVVGIAWVVECVENRAKVDEERFKIDIDMINVAGGTHKPRRSMFPKHLIPASPGPESEMSVHMSSEAEDDDGVGDMDGSPSQDPDTSMRSREDDDLPPLERARKRRSTLPGGQTRLIP